MKLIELINSVEPLNKLSETKLPASVSFSVAKFLKEATADLEAYNKVRLEKIKEYGAPVLDDKGDPTDKYSFSLPGSTELTEEGKKFIAEMTEIEERELTISIPEIKISDLSSVEIEPKNLAALTWLIK